MFQAYADGVNDFIRGVDALGSNPTTRLLPPEFLLLGITKENWTTWTPQDSLACAMLMSFNLSWNWPNDLLREALRQRSPDLEDLAEEIAPFAHDMLAEVITIVDEEDLKHWG